MRLGLKYSTTAWAALLMACGDDSGHTDAFGSEFWRLMNQTELIAPSRGESEIVRESTVIVRASWASVNDGRVVDYATGPSNPLAMAVFELDVIRTLKGNPGSAVYFEYIRGGASPREFERLLPQDEAMFFLAEANSWDADTYKIEEPTRGLPPGEILYELRTQQGVSVAAEGTIVQPLGNNPPLFAEVRSLDELEFAVDEILSRE